MNRQICKYSIIRFQPFVETEEFANVGIVLYAPMTKQLHFKLLSAREHERVTHFFKPLNREIYTSAIQIIRAELEHIQKLLTKSVVSKMDFYDELIRPREDIIQYSKNRVLFSTDVIKTVESLFEHYVKHEFAYQENYEEEMKKRIQSLLKNYGFEKSFKNGYVGDENKYKVHLPFVSTNAQAAIKPIHFKHSDPHQLIEHGLNWLMKITQLKRYGFIDPQNILFTYNPPEKESAKLFNAFNDVQNQIKDAGVVMTNINEESSITEFVQRYV